MTSLKSALPSPGSINWRTDRRADESVVYEIRVRHVVILTAEIVEKPKPHVVYFVDVMSQTDQWRVYRRYTEFLSLHQKMSKTTGIASTLFPGKAIRGNFTPEFISHRREMLERYLQRLVNMDPAPDAMQPLHDFLSVAEHDPIKVAAKLTKHIEDNNLLNSDTTTFHLTPSQLRCIGKRLHLPKIIPIGPPCNLEIMCEFAHQLRGLCVHPMQRKSLGFDPLESINVDLSIFRSLESLRVDHCVAKLFENWSHLNGTLQWLQFSNASIERMEEVFPATKPPPRVLIPDGQQTSSWRRDAVARLQAATPRTHPLPKLRRLDLGNNEISILDGGCLALLPALEILRLGNNAIADFDSWFRKGVVLRFLTVLDLSHNCLTSLHCEAKSSRTSSVSEASLPSDVQADGPPAPARWNRENKLGDLKRSSFGVLPASGLIPTPANTAPPRYDAAHLLTSADDVPPLDELQRQRAERLRRARSLPGSPQTVHKGTLANLPSALSSSAIHITGDDTLLPNSALHNRLSVSAEDKERFSPDSDEESDLTSEVSHEEPHLKTSGSASSSVFTTTSTPVLIRRDAILNPQVTASDGLIRGPMSGLALALLAPSLRELYVSHNALTSLSGLERLTCLKVLDVRKNQVLSLASCSAIVHLKDLSSLLLEGNPLCESDYVTNLRRLFGDGASSVLKIDGK